MYNLLWIHKQKENIQIKEDQMYVKLKNDMVSVYYFKLNFKLLNIRSCFAASSVFTRAIVSSESKRLCFIKLQSISHCSRTYAP